MKIVIIGAGSIAFTPAILSGFCADPRYLGATIGLVDVNTETLELVASYTERVSHEFGLGWTVEASAERRNVLGGADIVTASVGVGGLEAWEIDVDIPFHYGIIQPVGDTSGPGGLARALRHIPILVGIARDMEDLCPAAVFYNFTNPLTVLTQAVNTLTKIRCVGLCIGPDLTWEHLCGVLGVEKKDTAATIAGINHCHWVLELRLRGEDAFPLLRKALDSQNNPSQPLCSELFRHFGAYPGPGDGHVGEFYPQYIRSTVNDLESFQGHAIRNVKKTYPPLVEKMAAIARGNSPIDAEAFAREMYWEHTQLLDIIVSAQDNLGQIFHVNVPNRGIITNLPAECVVEVPAVVDCGGIHPFAMGDLPKAVLPMLQHKIASLDLIIEAAMEGSRARAVQSMLNDPHFHDFSTAEKVVNQLISAELAWLPNFQ